jgi:hypothetical protein
MLLPSMNRPAAESCSTRLDIEDITPKKDHFNAGSSGVA